MLKKNQRLKDLWDKNKRSKNHVISFPEGQDGTEKLVQKCLKQRIHKTEKKTQNPKG